MLGKMIATMLGVSTIFAPTTTKDIVIRCGEYENKPGKRMYVDSDFQVPDDIPLRKDERGYFISEWDINLKLAQRIYEYLKEYDIVADLQVANGKSEDLNAAGRIAKAKKPKVYLSVHHNSFKEDSTGYIYFVNPDDDKSYKYAQALSNAIRENPGNLPEWEVREQTSRYIGEMNEQPGHINILGEYGFFSNTDELSVIISDEQIDFVAKETAEVLYNIYQDLK